MTQTLHYTIQQGATLSVSVTVGAAYDGWTGRSKIRRSFDGGTLAEPTISTVSGGSLTISLTAAQTAALTRPVQARCDERIAFYGLHDVEITDGTSVVRAAEGKVFHSSEVTKD